MEYVRLENVGSAPVANPWLIVNSKRNWRTLEDVIAEVVTPDMSPREKALRLWWFQVNHRYHAFTGDDENNDEIKVLNVYGYTLCGNDAEVLGHLFQAAGLRVRPGHPTGHCTTEVFWDDHWHLLDGDENIIVPLRDCHTLAGESDIVRDHDLMKRTHTYGILSRDDRFRDEFSASLYTYEGERKEGRGQNTRHTMRFDLLPGEALVWRWDSRGKYHGREDLLDWGREALARIANGELVYEPDLRGPGAACAVTAHKACVVGERDVDLPAIHLAPRADQGHVDLALHSPYPFVGGNFAARLRGEGQVAATLVLGEETFSLGEVMATGSGELRANLDGCFPRERQARYDAMLRLALCGKAGVESLRLKFDLQMAPLSLPELELGENTVHYVDDSTARRVRVSLAWRELDFTRPPAPPPSPEFPADGARVQGTRISFRWPAAVDPDGDKIADYQFQLSEREDLAWPLSPNFHKLVSNTADRDKPQYTLPSEGLLAPNTTYYWRVRALDAAGVWGPWSHVWRFSCQVPAPPEGLECVADEARGEIRLRWRPTQVGSRPVRYRIYGSDEQGFSVSDVSYKILWTNQPIPNYLERPANFLAETTEDEILVVGPRLCGTAANQAFYRVVAIDEHNVRSGPSDYLALPRPFIYTRPPQPATPGQEYVYQPHSLASLGDLRCRPLKGQDGTVSYYNASFWDVEKPLWRKVAGPEWISIDPQSGLVSGRAPDGYSPTVATISVEIPGRGSDEQHLNLVADGP